jgi:hypothetical protein
MEHHVFQGADANPLRAPDRALLRPLERVMDQSTDERSLLRPLEHAMFQNGHLAGPRTEFGVLQANRATFGAGQASFQANRATFGAEQPTFQAPLRGRRRLGTQVACP